MSHIGESWLLVMKKAIGLIVIVSILILSACAAPAAPVMFTPASVQSDDVASVFLPPAVSPSVIVTDTQITPADEGDTDWDGGDTYVLTPEEQTLQNIVSDPGSYGYGPLPIQKPQISYADLSKFDPDKISDYLLSGLDNNFVGNFNLYKASLTNGKLYLTIYYDVYVDVNTAYKYLKNTFKLPDEEILGFDMFSDSECAIHDGCMYTGLAWDFKNDTMSNEEEISLDEIDLDPNAIGVDTIVLPKMEVAEDAVITLVDWNTEYLPAGCQYTTDEFANLILKGKNKSDNIDVGLGNLWFKYDGNVITGIAEEYSQ